MTGAQWRFSAQYRAAVARAHARNPTLEARLSARRATSRPFKSFTATRRNGAGNPPMRPMLSDLTSFTPEQARAYLKAAKNDELTAAIALAQDRNALDGSPSIPPDDA